MTLSNLDAVFNDYFLESDDEYEPYGFDSIEPVSMPANSYPQNMNLYEAYDAGDWDID